MFTTSTMFIRPNFSENRLLKLLIIGYAVLWIALAINPLYRFDWLLENILVFLFLPILIFTYQRFPLSDLSYLVITFFMLLHSVGAHYTYAEVPFGYWMEQVFGFSRNHFDRLVHFSFGLLMAYPIREIFLRVAHTKGFWSYYLPLDVTLATSALYELVEWYTAIVVSPEAAQAYLGSQGDVWDAHKDMGLAFLGSAFSMIITGTLRNIRARRRRINQVAT